MAITQDSGRQYPLVQELSFTYDDFDASGTAEVAIDVPAGAVVTSGFVVIDTAFNSVTSDTLTVGDGGSDARYKGSINAQSAALTALVPTGYKYTASDTIDIKWTGVGAAPSAGAGRLVVQYLVAGRSNENQG